MYCSKCTLGSLQCSVYLLSECAHDSPTTVITVTYVYTYNFCSSTLMTRSPWRDTDLAENVRATDSKNAVKYGETAGNTCLTLQPVLALVSMNMTFSSLALCSPSSIVICLQEKSGRFSILVLKANLFTTDILLLIT